MAVGRMCARGLFRRLRNGGIPSQTYKEEENTGEFTFPQNSFVQIKVDPTRRKHPKGTVLDVWYDPKNPKLCCAEKEADSKKLNQPNLLKEIEKFISTHNTCALATAGLNGFVRCTPIEYTYMNGCFWLLSEGGLKFKGLEVNKNV